MACQGLHPRVGIFAIISNEEGHLLIGRRLSALGKGMSKPTKFGTLVYRHLILSGHWGFPGGHLEQNEDFFSCVERETFEETGLQIKATKVVGLTNDKFPELNKHYVTVFTKGQRVDVQQEPQVSNEHRFFVLHFHRTNYAAKI